MRSANVEDRRFAGSGGAARGRGRKMGIGAAIVAALFGSTQADKLQQFASGGGGTAQAAVPASAPASPADDPERVQVEFMTFVLEDAQAAWRTVLPERMGTPYRDAKLVLFRDRTTSACGAAEAAMGPFYCTGDERVFLDLSFFQLLHRQFGAAGDFAQAYVIAHELGHHVQNLLGTTEKVARLQQRDPKRANQASVRLELQADCYAGVWAHSTARRDLLQKGDVEEALRAASVVGDDYLQKAAGQQVRPETFTHGTSAQRSEWFQRGLQSGDPKQCNTFASKSEIK
jgi:predicted metalloprotease